MIREVVINSQKIPIPVPIKEVADLVEWIYADLANKEQNLTRIIINGEDRTTDFDINDGKPFLLSGNDSVEIQLESAQDLVIASMEAVLSFSNVVLDGLKGVAVGLWQYDGKKIPEPVFQLGEDLRTLVEIYEHITEITEVSAEEVAAFEGLCRIIRRGTNSFDSAVKSNQWEKAAETLLNYLEPLVRELIEETSVLQVHIGIAPTGVLKSIEN